MLPSIILGLAVVCNFLTCASPSITVQSVSSIALTHVRSHSVHTNLLAAIGGA